jgi:flagellar P-ring protein FlgI
VLTSARIPNGAIVEREHTTEINHVNEFTLRLRNPDFSTVAAVADAINAFAAKKYNVAIATEQDDRSITIKRPPKLIASRLFAEIGEISVEAGTSARIVVDEKSGTIVIGSDVRISPVAVAHGSVVVKVTEEPRVSQPKPLSKGETVVVPTTDIEVEDTSGPVTVLRGPTIQRLVSGLNRMGLKPLEIVAILQSIKAAGALQAELVVH